MKNDQSQTVSADKLRILKPDIKAGEGVPQEVVKHLEENLVTPTKLSSICVDGGYRPDEALGELARPGADLGLSIILMALGFRPEEAFQIVFNYRVTNGQKYGWHTDTHDDGEQHGDKLCGCGHCNVAFKEAKKYYVNPEDVRELLEIIKEKQPQEPQNMRFIRLNRNHQEEGVLIINSTNATVLPWDQKTSKQFFVYDRARDEQLLAEILQEIKKADPTKQITLEKLIEIAQEHANLTLANLPSSQGKPIYEVSYNNKTVTVELTGRVPSQQN